MKTLVPGQHLSLSAGAGTPVTTTKIEETIFEVCDGIVITTSGRTLSCRDKSAITALETITANPQPDNDRAQERITKVKAAMAINRAMHQLSTPDDLTDIA
jgi:hypothetical protein